MKWIQRLLTIFLLMFVFASAAQASFWDKINPVPKQQCYKYSTKLINASNKCPSCSLFAYKKGLGAKLKNNPTLRKKCATCIKGKVTDWSTRCEALDGNNCSQYKDRGICNRLLGKPRQQSNINTAKNHHHHQQIH